MIYVAQLLVCGASCDTMWHHGPSCDTMWHHVTPCDIMAHHVTPCDIMWHHVTSWPIMWQDADHPAPGGHPVGHQQGDDDLIITLTAADRGNKSWFLNNYVIPFIILVIILSFHPTQCHWILIRILIKGRKVLYFRPMFGISRLRQGKSYYMYSHLFAHLKITAFPGCVQDNQL